MLAKRLFKKVIAQSEHKGQQRSTTSMELDFQVAVHYGIPYTASTLAFDPIQRLLAVGTLDGRIKILGGDNIEGILVSPKKLPYRNLEFFHNQGLLIGVTNENDIQVWDLEYRRLAYCLQWESNITAFAIIQGTYLMYLGDDNGLISVLKYNAEEGKLIELPYHIPLNVVFEAAEVSVPDHQSVVEILPQPGASGTRVLIAYENGLLTLWDISVSRLVAVRGHTDLQLKNTASFTNEDPESETNDEQEEKEICSLCWASSDGCVVAVGYINGDILLWDFSPNSVKEQKVSNNVVKLQLASGSRRLPVIVLHWSPSSKVKNDKGGQLFIYGGDEMGSEEVLTVLSIEWQSGIETVKCLSRVDLSLNGSFADMILIPDAGSINNYTAAAFVLTNPGQLSIYDGAIVSMLKPDEGKPILEAERFPVVVPTIDPLLTATKLCKLPRSTISLKTLLEAADIKRTETAPVLSAGTKWPLTGGVPSELSLRKENEIERIYIAGYKDGSVRVWDATFPTLALLLVVADEIPAVQMDSISAAVTAIDFCTKNMILTVGNECGLVRIYKLHGSTDAFNFHFVTENKNEAHAVPIGKGFNCVAAFTVLDSRVQSLKFTNSGEKLAVGFETGQVVVLDICSPSITFRMDSISTSMSPILSIVPHALQQLNALVNSPTKLNSDGSRGSEEEVLLILTKDANIVMIDSTTGKMISSKPLHPKRESSAISMYVIDAGNGKDLQHVDSKNSIDNLPVESADLVLDKMKEEESDKCLSSDARSSKDMVSDLHVLLCCEDALRLYSLKSVVKGDNNFIRKVNLETHCCWSTIFQKRDESECALILLYETGVIQMRSLPELEVLAESSLMSILRWSFKTNMDKTMSSSDHGQIALVNGCEVAFITLLSFENVFRIPESLPCLHDKVVAAAARAAISFSSNQKKSNASGILGGLVKGFRGGKVENSVDTTNNTQRLEGFFARDPCLKLSTSSPADQEAYELSIDDIIIDEMPPPSASSSQGDKKSKRDEGSEREKLFQGASSDTKPRVRTSQEILTQYKFGGDAAAAATHARDKLAERQEKLERLSKHTEELQNEAANFADLANELVKTMENKKWWKL